MKTIGNRFMSFIQISNTGCWEWTGSKNPSGYGLMAVGRKAKLAHRLSWEFTYGFEPVGLVVCHKCDNRKCVNPEHLFLGDNKDNAKDKIKKGRHVQAYGNSKLTIDKIKEIRNLWVTGNYSQIKLADMYGVKHSCIGRIINNNKWGGVELDPIDRDVWNKVHNNRKIMNINKVSS